jgi:AP-4 complex subunit beta-1
MQKVLGKVFKSIIENESEDIDLKDRASFYYKSLLQTPQKLIEIVHQVIKVNQFLEDKKNLIENSSFEFNTLSVIFDKPAFKFIKSS